MTAPNVDGLGMGPDGEPEPEEKDVRPWRYCLALAHRTASLFRWGAASGFRILHFHDIPDEKTNAFSIFAEAVVQRHGTITPQDAEAWLVGMPPKWVAATRSGCLPCLFAFDDGFASNYRIAREVLEPLGIKALFFIAPGLIGLPEDEQRERIAWTIFDGALATDELPPDLRLMTWEEISSLKDMGNTIGAHGMLHRRLTRLAGDELEWEIIEARVQLALHLGAPPAWYAYAFGDIGSISRSAIELIGAHYRYCRSGVRGVNDRATAPLALRSEDIELSAPLAYQKLTTEGGLDGYYCEERNHLDRVVSPRPNLPDDDDGNPGSKMPGNAAHQLPQPGGKSSDSDNA
jgi:peptidoglycan/xylan/chitin deacetylase (PgdA/CDA1 family)